MAFSILLLVVGLALLVGGGEWLVRGASSIALRLRLSPLVVGLTIVAFGTSAPELFISVRAALEGSPDLAMGNVIGSNICNLALVLGVTAVITSVPVRRDSMRIDWPVTMGASLLLYLVVLDNLISWPEGLLFIAILATYTYLIIRKSRRETKSADEIAAELDVPPPTASLRKDLLLIGVGTAGLAFGSNWFVDGAQDLAIAFGVSERVVGITVLALGTSLPELVTAVIAATKKETDIALGNLMGSNIFNILSILGITSVIASIRVNDVIIHSDMIWMLLITFLVLPMMLYRRTIAR
ncbi:MAG: calcium/sodium antiporter, partial [Tunicatimonas sp.]